MKTSVCKPVSRHGSAFIAFVLQGQCTLGRRSQVRVCLPGLQGFRRWRKAEYEGQEPPPPPAAEVGSRRSGRHRHNISSALTATLASRKPDKCAAVFSADDLRISFLIDPLASWSMRFTL